jgi:uncharacterized membrane protein
MSARDDEAIAAGPSHVGAVLSAGTLLGVGLGGFLDGIVLHQLLQWHNMLSSRLPPTDLVSLKVNMLWDGLFHLFTWIVTVVGLALLWRAGRAPRSTRTLVGGLALGWGLFNVVEGLINHQILGLHHVHPGAGEVAWDLGFLLFGAALCLVGAALVRSGRRRRSTPAARPVPAPTGPGV